MGVQMVERDYLHLSSPPAPAGLEGLELYELQMQTSGNPLYAWLALAHLADRYDLGSSKPFAIPAWVAETVLAAAVNLRSLTLGLPVSQGPEAESAPKEALPQVTQALGLSRGGWNAFATIMRDHQNIDLLATYDVLHDAGLRDGAIYAILAGQDTTADLRGLRRKIAAARALMGAKPRQAKRRRLSLARFIPKPTP
jgi:hypothetical protein